MSSLSTLLSLSVLFAGPAGDTPLDDEPAPVAASAPEAAPQSEPDEPEQEGPAPGPVTELTGQGTEPAPGPEAEGPAPARPAPTDAERPPGPGQTAPVPAPAPTVERERRPKRTWPDRPIRYRIEGAMMGGTDVPLHPSYLAFDDDRKLPGFDAALRLDYRVGEGRVFLGGGLFYRRHATAGALYDVTDFDEMVLHEPGLALRLAVMTVEGIDVYAELAGAPTILDISGDYDGTAGRARQRKVTGMGSGMGGLMLYLPKRWLPRKGSSRVTLGIDAGFGYAFRGNVAVQPTPDVDDDAIDTQTAPLGDVVTRGLTWRLGLFLRVM